MIVEEVIAYLLSAHSTKALEKTKTLSNPTYMTRMDGAKIAKPLGQIAPGDARMEAIEHGFQEQAIVFGGGTGIRGLAGGNCSIRFL